MNDKSRQFLVLFALLIFLSMITIFHVRMTDTSPDKVQDNSSERNLSEVKFEKKEGDGLLIQSINGLIGLYRDLLTGVELISNPQSSG